MTVTVAAPRKVPDFLRRWPEDRVALVQPPVDTDHHSPSVTPSDFRQQHGLDTGATTVVLASRLVAAFKLEGVERAVEAVAALAADRFVQLMIVGDGEARHALEQRADEINGAAGRRVVAFIGELADPRPAYAAADVVVGVGIALLDGMAHGKPGIALGREGFSEIVDPSSVDGLEHRGFYGLGDGSERGSDRLREQLRDIVDDADARRRLGAFARDLVVTRYGIERIARTLDAAYERVASQRATPRSVVDAALTPARLARYRRLERRLKRWAAANGLEGDRADAKVYLALADRLASRPAAGSDDL